MTCAVKATVNLKALRNNLRCVTRAAPDSKILAVIKANAYGHGLVSVAEALCSNDISPDALGVARLEEAVLLRDAGIKAPLVLLEGFSDAAELELIRRHDLAVAIHHPYQVEILENNKFSRPVTVWLKIDTGMHRLGVRPEQAGTVIKRLLDCGQVARPLHLMTHFACADDRNNPLTIQQIDSFNAVTKQLSAERSMANSAAILAWPDSVADWVRPGIMLYGASPFIDAMAAEHGLEPVMTLESSLIAVNNYRKGESIGYGGSWTCPEDMPVGVVAIGYGDGYPRSAVNGTPVMVNGQRVPLVGRVSMDMICVDLRSQPDARCGDRVILWGQGLPVEEIARCAGTISYELLCGVTSRVEFTYQ